VNKVFVFKRLDLHHEGAVLEHRYAGSRVDGDDLVVVDAAGDELVSEVLRPGRPQTKEGREEKILEQFFFHGFIFTYRGVHFLTILHQVPALPLRRLLHAVQEHTQTTVQEEKEKKWRFFAPFLPDERCAEGIFV
jgi:hypothetical protein